jgi:Fic family protein
MSSLRFITYDPLSISAKTSGAIARAETALVRADAILRGSRYHKTIAETVTLLEAASTRDDADNSLLLTNLFGERWEKEEAPVAGENSTETSEVERYIRTAGWVRGFVSPTKKITSEIVLDLYSRSLSGRGHHQSGICFRVDPSVERVETPLGPVIASSPEDIFAQVRDLCNFINRDAYSPVVQAAITYYHYKHIHPFEIDDEYSALSLCHAVLARRGLVRATIAPISLFAKFNPKTFSPGFALRADSDDLKQEGERTLEPDTWINFCAGSLELAAAAIDALCDIIEALESSWNQRLGCCSKGSLLEEVLALLPCKPIFTVETIMHLTGRSFSTTNDVLSRLSQAGILSVSYVTRQKARVFKVTDVFRSYEAMLDTIMSRFLISSAFHARLLN